MNKNHSGHQHHGQLDQDKPKPFYKSFATSTWIVLAAVVVITLFYLVTRHKTHVLDVLPYLLILAMILMHLGGHGGHSHGGDRHEK